LARSDAAFGKKKFYHSKMESSIAADGYVGSLTESQAECLKQVKKRLENELSEHYDDIRICRFLRARNFDEEKSVEMIKEDIRWRKELGVDDILKTFPQSNYYQALINYWPARVYGDDIYSVPIWWERLALVEPKSFVSNVPEEELIKFHIWLMERAEMRCTKEFFEKTGKKNQYGTCYVQDLAGLGWKHFYMPALGKIRITVEIDQAHYPESLRKMYIVNAPSIFNTFWKLISPWLDKRTVSKIEVCGSNYLELLAKEMDPSIIPSYLGGPCIEADFTGGGVWPGSLYQVSSDKFNCSTLVTIAPRDLCEVLSKVEHEGSVIGWKFSISKHDIAFGLYFQKPDNSREEVVKMTRFDSREGTIEGSITVMNTGTYVFLWDNSFSYLTKKHVTYEIFIHPPIQPSSEKDVVASKKEDDSF